MEELRIREKNIINIKIKDVNSYIKKNTDTVARLATQGITDFVRNQTKKLESKNIEYEKELNMLKERLININNGSLDSELQDFANTNKDIINKKTTEKREKKTEEKTIQKVKEKENFQISKDMDKNYNPKIGNEWEMKKSLSFFYKLCDELPDYMVRNLKEMPNNKGYIHRGIWCFGELEAEKNQPIILFEKLKNEIMRIHEIDSEYYNIFEKQGKYGKRILLSSYKRKKLNKISYL